MPSSPRPHEEAFLGDEILTAAVLHRLTVIGEAFSRLPDDLRARHPEVPSSSNRGSAKSHRARLLRPRLADPLWDAATIDIPQLHRQILHIQTTDFPQSE